MKDKIPLKWPTLKIGNKVITPSIKFLGVMLDENVSWRYHIKAVENKLSIKYWFIMSCNNIFFIYSFFFKLCKYCMG